jgi:hypothetical protein
MRGRDYSLCRTFGEDATILSELSLAFHNRGPGSRIRLDASAIIDG